MFLIRRFASMKASELIARLETLKAEHGDLEVIELFEGIQLVPLNDPVHVTRGSFRPNEDEVFINGVTLPAFCLFYMPP